MDLQVNIVLIARIQLSVEQNYRVVLLLCLELTIGDEVTVTVASKNWGNYTEEKQLMQLHDFIQTKSRE